MNRVPASKIAALRARIPDKRKAPDPEWPEMEVLSAEEWAVVRAIRDTAYGAIEVVLHQARIVQIVKTEKLRLETHSASP